MNDALTSQTFDELRLLGHRAVAAGRLEQALELLEQALGAARESGDQDRIDLAVCNRSAVAIALGQHQEVQAELRPILLRNSQPDICFLAADGLSRAHELGKDFKKGLFYSRAARGYAERTGKEEWLASSFNQAGNCLVGTSRFQEAAGEYRRALELVAEAPSVVHAGLLVNLGYCKMMLGDLRGGCHLSFKALRWYRQLPGGSAYEAWPHLDLSYAYLEQGRLDRARQHGRSALELAEETGETSVLKNALFLLGETEKACGDLGAAYACFHRLQSRFYPENPQMLSVLTAIGMRQVVNLRA